MKTTLQEVANLAGVSKALVSKYLTNAPDARMREGTRRRIEEAVRRTGYAPSRLAQSLKRGKTQTIGLVISELCNAFWASVTDMALREALRGGYRLLISLGSHTCREEAEHLRSLSAFPVDGILFCEHFGRNAETERMREQKYPMMLLYQESPDFLFSTVSHASALRDAVAFLRNGNVADIFCMHSEFSPWPVLLAEECRKQGIPYAASSLSLVPEEQFRTIREICRRAPSAIFLNGWRMTLLLLQILEREFPAYEPKIVMNVNFEHPAFLNPRITGFVRHDFREVVRAGVQNLIDSIEGRAAHSTTVESRFIPGSLYREQRRERYLYY